MSQSTKPIWNPSVKTKTGTTSTTSRTGQPSHSLSVRRKPVPAVDSLEPSTSSSTSTGAATGLKSSSSGRISRSRVSSMTSTASTKSSTSGPVRPSTVTSSPGTNIPRPRVMSASTSSTSLRSNLSTSPKSASGSGSHRSSSPKPISKSTMSTRSTSPSRARVSSSQLPQPTSSSPSVTPGLRPALSTSNLRSNTSTVASSPPQIKRSSAVSAVSTSSNYSQKSFSGNEQPSSSPEQNVNPHVHPVDDPGGSRHRVDEGDLEDGGDGEMKADRSAVKSGYGSVFGFGGHSASSDGSPTSDTFLDVPSRASQSSISSETTLSSNHTLPAPQPPKVPAISTAASNTSSSGIVKSSLSTPTSASVSTSPSSASSPNVDHVRGPSHPVPPVRPPRARPPPMTKSQSSPSVASPSILPSSSTPRIITPSTQPNSSVDTSYAIQSKGHLSPASTPSSRSHPPNLNSSSRSRSSSRASHSPSLSPAGSPPLPVKSRPSTSSVVGRDIIDAQTSKTTVSTSSPVKIAESVTKTRGRSLSRPNVGTVAFAVKSVSSTGSGSTGASNARMTDPKRSLPKTEIHKDDEKKDVNKDGQPQEDKTKEKRRDRAESSATLKNVRPSSSTSKSAVGKTMAPNKNPPQVSTAASSSDKVSSMPNPSESQRTTQSLHSSPSSRTPQPSSSPTVNPSLTFPSSVSITSPTSSPPRAIQSHTQSPPRSHRPSHGHSHLNGPPSPGVGMSLKQLLSKPAPPGYTSAGSASESEGYVSRGSKPFCEKDRERRIMQSTADAKAVEGGAHDEAKKMNLTGVERDKERRREWEAERRLLRERSIERTRTAVRERVDSGALTSGDEGPSTRGRSFTGLMRSASLTRLRERDEKDQKGKEKEKRQRNVLRRKPSGTLAGSSSSRFGKTSPLPPKEEQVVDLPHQRQNRTYAAYAPPMLPLSPTLPISPHSPQVMPSTSGTQTLRPLGGIVGSRSSSSSGSRSRSNDRSRERQLGDMDGGNSEGMTPAKEIMMRYKQQQSAEDSLREKMETKEREAEERNKVEWEKEEKSTELRDREQREKEDSKAMQGSSVSTLQESGYKDSDAQQSMVASTVDVKNSSQSEESAVMPYYTVFGSTSGRVVAVGRPEDSFYGSRPELSRNRSVSQPTPSGSTISPISPQSNPPQIKSSTSPLSLSEFSWGTSLTEGLDLSLTFGTESTGSGINGGLGLDRLPEGALQLGEVWERKTSVTAHHNSKDDTADEDKANKLRRIPSFGVFGSKTLSRKMSARWGKKGGLDSFGSIGRDSLDIGTVESVPVYSGPYGGIAGIEATPRPSLQERRASTGLGLGKRKASMSALVNKSKGTNDLTSGGRSLRLSIDKLADTPDASPRVPENPADPVDSSLNKGTMPTHIHPTLPTPPLSAPQNSSSPLQSSPVSAGTGAPAPKGKLWKLMKRLSTGGLRDRYHYAPDSSSSSSPSPASPLFSQSLGEVPPPVPALPKDLANYRANNGLARTSLSTIATASGSPAASGRQSRASSAHTSTSASSSKIPIPATPGGTRIPPPLPPLTPVSTSQARPGTAGTHSSSPISSSDRGSSKNFNKTHSRRSSTSSLGEVLVPPLPTLNPNSSSGSLGTSGSSNAGKVSLLQHHIVPPSELYRLQLNFEHENDSSLASTATGLPSSSMAHVPKSSLGGKSGRVDDYMIIRTPAEEYPAFSLPVPPDWRGVKSRDRERDVENTGVRRFPSSDDGRPPSPIIPTFSTAGAINTWSKPKNKTDRGRSQVSPRSDAALFDAFPIAGRRSMSIPRTHISSSTSSRPPLPSGGPRRPATANSPSSAGSSVTSPTRPKAQSEDFVPSPIPPQGKVPSSPSHTTRKSIGTNSSSPSQSRFPTTPITNLSRVPSTPSGVVSLSTPHSASTSVAPWDSPLYSADGSSIISASSVPTKKSWLSKGWKTSLSEKEKAAKWDDLLQRSERAGGTLHLGGGSGLLSDRYSMGED